MALSEISSFLGIFGSLAGIGSLYYAWKTDKLARFIPHNPQIDEAFSGNPNAPGLAARVRDMLGKIVDTRRELRVALSVAKTMHFAKPMDEALFEINRRAIELNELAFAFRVAQSAHFAVSLDSMLQNVVDAALARNDIKLAHKCANRMHFAMPADRARKQIIEWLKTRPSPSQAQ